MSGVCWIASSRASRVGNDRPCSGGALSWEAKFGKSVAELGGQSRPRPERCVARCASVIGDVVRVRVTSYESVSGLNSGRSCRGMTLYSSPSRSPPPKHDCTGRGSADYSYEINRDIHS